MRGSYIMKSIKLISVLVSLTFTTIVSGQNTAISKPKIEIYLISKLTRPDSLQPKNNYFLPTANDLSDTAFIKDEEILSYKIYQDSAQHKIRKLYSFLLNSSGQKKINDLKNIPLCCGKKFAVVLNNKPVFGAYFWNLYSSFGCTWLTTVAFHNAELVLMKGLPENYFDETKQDPRDNKDLIDAFKSTGRLIVNSQRKY